MNHDVSLNHLLNPTDRINRLLERYRNGEMKAEQQDGPRK